MNLCRIRSSITIKSLKPRCFSSSIAEESEYTSTPQYPEILDLSLKAKLERKRAAIRDEILKVKTVEEKQIKLNMPKYYGFKTNLVQENDIPYNSLNYFQHITKTHLIVNEQLPEFYHTFNVDDVDVKSQVEEAIYLEIEGYKKLHEINKTDLKESDLDDLVSNAVTKQINRVIVNKLARNNPHLLTAQVDFDPRHETFWFCGGLEPPNYIVNTKKSLDFMQGFENEPIDRGFYYTGQPNLTLRSELPLQPIIPHSESENPEFSVPNFEYDPRVLGVAIEHKFMANVPGFWPGDQHEFGLISYHKRGHLHRRAEKYFNAQDDDQEALHSQGIVSSFGWLHAQANFLGFNTFNDITYPLVTQTVITNGQKWSFYVYQLNTTALFQDSYERNPKKNLCWAIPESKLYESVDSNGKLIGFNDDTLKTLLKFYVNVPKERLGVNLRPYLSSEEKLVADYENAEKRQWLEREYKYLVSNRPRHVPIDEIYMWERIYKINHNSRFMDKKLRFFELKQHPKNRRLNDRLGNYVPRALRPDLPRHKGRRANEYWP